MYSAQSILYTFSWDYLLVNAGLSQW